MSNGPILLNTKKKKKKKVRQKEKVVEMGVYMI